MGIGPVNPTPGPAPGPAPGAAPGAGHAPARLIRMHAADRVCESPRGQRHPIPAGLVGAKFRQGHSIAAELRRAVNRQRNELGRLRSIERRMTPLVGPQPDDAPPTPAPVTYHRKSYAPAPIGHVPMTARVALAEPAPAPVESVPMVTNLGTLIDILA